MRKMRWRAFVCAVCAVWLAASCLPAAADGMREEFAGEETEDLPQKEWEALLGGEPAAAQTATLSVEAPCAVLMDLTSGEILFAQAPDERRPIASVTKVMTLLLTFEAIDDGLLGLSDALTCSPEAAAYGGSQIWLEPGEQMTVDDLLKAVAVVSANDACAVLAETIAGSVEGFVARMNERAAQLGMTNTRFADCCGLDDTAYATARDVAIMSRQLMTHREVTRYTTVWTDTLRGGQSELVNTNKLIRFYDGATGLKTGTTAAAGHCLSATAERGGMGLCAVVLGCATTADRFGSARRMLDYGFANYTLFTPDLQEATAGQLPVLRGERPAVSLRVEPPAPVLLCRGQEGQVRTCLALPESVEAPVLPDQVVGEVTLTLDGGTIARYPVRAGERVDRLTLFGALGWLWRALCA